MILKNPYGYLIKYFKPIHLLLTGLYIYLLIKVNSLLNYYNSFINGTASKLDARGYITYFYLIAIVLSIIICLVIYVLMRYKKKPRFIYLLLIGIYIIVAVFISLVYGGLDVIYISVLEMKILRLYRDILRIMIVVQFITVIMMLFRGLGFDIKKFNFVSDLEGLDLNEKDMEEIEVSISSNGNLLRKARRSIREFRYYFLENKAFIIISLVLVAFVLLSFVFLSREVVNKVYHENEVFSIDQFQGRVINTYITRNDLNGRTISSFDDTFVIVKLNLSGNHTSFSSVKLMLQIGNQHYLHSSKYASSFNDLGIVYQNYVVDKASNYLFVYQIPSHLVSSDMYLNYNDTKRVLLKPTQLDTVSYSSEYSLNTKLDLSNSVLGGGYLNISSYLIDKSFTYPYHYQINGEDKTVDVSINSEDGFILFMDVSYDIPDEYSLYSFLSNFATLKYKVKDVEYSSSKFYNKTPNNVNNQIYLAVDNNIGNADKIWLEFVVRNCKYIYNLK